MNIETCEALRIDERGEVTWTQLIELSGLGEAELRELVDDGALEPIAPEAPAWSFHGRAIVVARTAGRLRRELDLDAHALAVLLLFAFLHRATGAVWRSAFVAFVFALHPLHVESVAWISERKDVLSAFFCFLALWAYTRYAERPAGGRPGAPGRGDAIHRDRAGRPGHARASGHRTTPAAPGRSGLGGGPAWRAIRAGIWL